MTQERPSELRAPLRELAHQHPVNDRAGEILAAAYDLLDEEGLDGFTIRALLKRTGLARRAVYDRYPGKDDLMLAVFRHAIEIAVQHFELLIAKIDDPVERLRLIIGATVIGGGSVVPPDQRPARSLLGAALSREHLRLVEARPDELNAALHPLVALLSRQLAAGMEQGRIRRADPDRLATLVYNLLSTTMHNELIGLERNGQPGATERADLAAELWTFCRGAVAA